MTINSELTINLLITICLSFILLMVTEPALALNVEKIGKGVVGNEREKYQYLKIIVFYTGIFFAVLGAIVTAFRKRKFALQKRSDTSNAVGPFLIVFGFILMLAKLL